MTDKNGPGQADEKAAEDPSADVAAEDQPTEDTSATATSLQVDQTDVEINRDVEITEPRAEDTHTR